MDFGPLFEAIGALIRLVIWIFLTMGAAIIWLVFDWPWWPNYVVTVVFVTLGIFAAHQWMEAHDR